MDTRDFLLEIGVEEIPAGFIIPTMQKIEQYFNEQLQGLKLQYSAISSYSTPRRFAIKVKDLQIQQLDEKVEKVGPAAQVAYDAEGKLTKAGEGFLKGSNASLENVYIKETAKGRYIAVEQEIKGKTAEVILPELVTQLIAQLTFPKSMKWGSCTSAFARPIRWLICMLDQQVLPVKVGNVESSNYTYGNRYLGLNQPITLDSVQSYPQILEPYSVLADREERKTRIQEQLDVLYKQDTRKVIKDDRLLEQVTDLVEYPTAVIAEFDEKYLQLPEKIITSTLTQNQKYFCVQDEKAKLSNQFVFVSNGDASYSELIRLGNQKVVKARLEDATFYYHEDIKQPLSVYVEKLKEVVFQAKLGTLLEKTERNLQLVSYIASQLKLTEEETNKALTTMRLAKADLVTNMLGEKEFTKLQGYIGMHYALATGEDSEVAKGIYEHYMPRGQNDTLPTSIYGAIAAIADKMDTVCGIMGVDLIPTGSNDPFALRRAANGIVQIINEREWALNWGSLVEESFELLNSKFTQSNKNKEKVLEFMQQRVIWLLETNGIRYDVIQAISHLPMVDLSDTQKRARILQQYKEERSDFTQLILSFKRVSNILPDKGKIPEVKKELLTLEQEIVLYNEVQKLALNLRPLLAARDYQKAFESLVGFTCHIDLFFEHILVNTEEMEVRNNRYALLKQVRNTFLEIADLSKIVTENE